MRQRPTALAVAAVLASAGAGCGSDDTPTTGTVPSAGTVSTQVEEATSQAESKLSPEARTLLGDVETLAGRAARTARDYAQGDITPEQASETLGSYSDRAEDLGKKAEELPESDPARKQIADLAAQTRSTAESLRERADAGDVPSTSEVQDTLRKLSDQGRTALERYGDQLPQDARDRVEKAAESLLGR